MKIFVSAAEISSDIHAEKILKSIQKKLQSQNISIEWMGIGGPRVSALPGFRSIESADRLRTMGFVEVLKKISFFKKLIDRTANEIKEFNPDLILTFDYPDFHFRLMQKVVEENLAPAALRVCGIPPKVWVWRSQRIEKIRRLYHGVWVIFPFEKNFYESRQIPVIFEGNPLLEDLFSDENVTKKPLETITVMPGSRDAELKYHLPVIAESLERFAKKTNKKITVQVPVPAGVEMSLVKNGLKNSDRVEFIFLPDGSVRSLKETHIGLIKSGTATLESVVLDCVPVIFYKMNWFSEQIFRFLIKGWGGYLGPVGLPNILLGIKKREASYFPELLGPEATAENLSHQLFTIYSDAGKRNYLLDKGREVREQFHLQSHAKSSADRSAEQILKWKSNPPLIPLEAKNQSIFISFVSFMWSSLNFIRRRLVQAKLMRSYDVKIPSILVGNLQAGGAGKTPLVIALAKEATDRGKKVAVISRGYGSTPENPLGDEPQEILASIPNVILSVNRNRIKAIREAEKQNPDLIIFDDGFQNLKFKAKTNLLAVTERQRNEVPYRDFDSEARFADIIVGTKGSNFRTCFTEDKKKFFKLDWQWDHVISQPVWLFCAIADPDELVHFYRQRGLVIKKVITKPDHAAFSEVEVKKMMKDASDDGCKLAMTEKDRVKILALSSEILVLKRSIRNRDWMDQAFESTLERDESP